VAARHPLVPLPRELDKIGAVASRSGLSVKTIRFYCDEGLIQPSGRSEGGYRLFAESVFAELTLIRTLRAMEIPLPDVSRILEARRSGLCTCSDLKARIRDKACEIGERIVALQGLQAELFGMLDSWEACGAAYSIVLAEVEYVQLMDPVIKKKKLKAATDKLIDGG